MKLWLLDLTDAGNAESPNWDVAVGFIIRAEDEVTARAIASKNHMDEGAAFWLNPRLTTCVELSADGPSGVVLSSFVNG